MIVGEYRNGVVDHGDKGPDRRIWIMVERMSRIMNHEAKGIDQSCGNVEQDKRSDVMKIPGSVEGAQCLHGHVNGLYLETIGDASGHEMENLCLRCVVVPHEIVVQWIEEPDLAENGVAGCDDGPARWV